jgi:hypothetical protein
VLLGESAYEKIIELGVHSRRLARSMRLAREVAEQWTGHRRDRAALSHYLLIMKYEPTAILTQVGSMDEPFPPFRKPIYPLLH